MSEPVGVVYFLIEEGGERIKIGKTRNLEIRMRDLGRLSSRPLHLACLAEGYDAVEKYFHATHASDAVLRDDGSHHGEWFHLTERVAATVSRILDGATSDDICPEHVRADRAKAGAEGPQTPPAIPSNVASPVRLFAESPLAAPPPEPDTTVVIHEKREEMVALHKRIRRRRCRERLSEFCKDAWHALHPTTRLEWSWHHDAICDHIQWGLECWMLSQQDPDYVIPDEARWVLVNCPPGVLKTEIVMVFAPAWMWVRWAGWRVLCLSSNPKVALDSAVLSRQVITSSWYKETFQPEWELRDDQNAKGNFANSMGGSRMSHGMTASVVGEHADAIFLDDPNDPKAMNSKASREEVATAWDSAIQNRVTDERNCLRFMIQQRLDIEDLTGHVTRKKGNKWTRVKLAMEFEANDRCATPMPVNANGRLELSRDKVVGTWADPRTHEGEVLHPARFPPGVIEIKKGEHGPYGYACTPAETPILMDDWTERRIEDVRAGDKVVGFSLGTPEHRGRLTPAEVLNVVCLEDEVFELEMESGRTVRCTADHRWFARQRNEPGRTSYTEVTPGSTRLGLVAEPLRGQAVEERLLWYYLAGIIDGEGCLRNRALTIAQCPEANPEVFARIEEVLRELGLSYRKWQRPSAEKRRARGQYTVHNVLHVYRELLRNGLGKREQARDALYRRGGSFIKERDRVLAMRSLGVQKVYALETTTGNYVAWGYASSNCQYQQRPTLREGGMVKRKWWRFFRLDGHTAGDRPRPPDCVTAEEHPAFVVKSRGKGWDLDFIEITIDAANKKTDRGSQYGLLAAGGKENRRFILSDKSQRGDFLYVLEVIRGMIRDWRPTRLLIEDKAAGPQIISTLKEEIASGRLLDHDGQPIVCAIEPLEPDGDKTARMEAVTPTLAANLVHLLEGAEWLDDFVDEVCAFPNGLTDRGDALSQFLAQHRMGDYASLIAQGNLRLF